MAAGPPYQLMRLVRQKAAGRIVQGRDLPNMFMQELFQFLANIRQGRISMAAATVDGVGVILLEHSIPNAASIAMTRVCLSGGSS